MPSNTDDNNRLEGHKVIAFARNLELVAQQMLNRLTPHVTSDMNYSEKGDRYTSERLGSIEVQPVTQALRDSPGNLLDKLRRWAFFAGYECGAFIETKDKVEQLVDPTNGTVRTLAAARERRHDSKIASSFFADSYATNANGEIKSTAFPSGQIIAVNDWTYTKGKADGGAAGSGNICLTPAKVRKAKVLISKSNIMLTAPPKLMVEEEDMQNMLTSIEVTSRDYVQVQALVNGETNMFGGFEFVKVNSGVVPQLSSTTWGLPAWIPSEMTFKRRPLTNQFTVQRFDKAGAWYTYFEEQDSCLREQDGGVVQIICLR